MALSRERRAYLVRHIGEERVAAIEKGLEEKEEALKAGGIAYKEVGSLRETFDAIVGNIMAAQLTAGEKATKVKAATAEMEKRMNVLGRREERPTLPDTPGGRALAQLIRPSPGKHLTKELKEMAESPNPGARALAQIVGASGPGRQG